MQGSSAMSELQKFMNEFDRQDIRLVVTGSRDWEDNEVIRLAVRTVASSAEIKEAIHGDARGADQKFAMYCRREDAVSVTSVPALWKVHTDRCPDWHEQGETCNMAGMRRNLQMAEMSPDLCLAFRLNESPGTTSMIKICKSKGIPVILFDL